MENPRWWGPVLTLLNDTIEDHNKPERERDGVMIIGSSLGRVIFHALKDEGYLSEKALGDEQHHVDVMAGKKNGIITILGKAISVIDGKELK